MREEELLKMLSDLWTYYEVGDQTLKKDRKLFAAPTDVQYEINLKDHDECIVAHLTKGKAPSRRYSVFKHKTMINNDD